MVTNIVKEPELYDLLYEDVNADIPLYIKLTETIKLFWLLIMKKEC